jgi:hypothetical protein
VKFKVFILLACLLPASFVQSVHADATLPIYGPCKMTNELPCVDRFLLVDANGNEHEASLSGNNIPYRGTFAGQSESGTDYQWRVAGLDEPGGSLDYTLLVEKFPYGTPYCWLPKQNLSTCDTKVDEIVIRVFPPDEYRTSNLNISPRYTYKIDFRLPSDYPIGMLIGHGKSGSVQISSNSDGSREAHLVGTPATLTIYRNNTPANGALTYTGLSFWIHSQMDSAATWANRCNNGEILSWWRDTNNGSDPIWSARDNSMEMQLDAPHLREDGSLNEGSMQVQVPLKMARCLWGIDLTHSVSASVSASYADSTTPEIIATTASIVGNYYYLNSNGFHFSSPTVKVKLVQSINQQSPVPSVSPQVATPSATPSQSMTALITPSPVATGSSNASVAMKSAVITCIKGSLVKKFSSPKGQCPAGYKKK